MKGLGVGFGVVAVMSVFSSSVFANGRVIGGVVVDSDAVPEVVRIKSATGHCTATLVGPEVIATAAHCADDGGYVTFSLNGSTHRAKVIHSSLYASDGHDVALGVLDKEITDPTPVTIGAAVDVGDKVEMYGYGCTKQGGGGGNDGTLRMAKLPVSSFKAGNFVTQGESALCFGDSGGPAFNGYNMVGIASKGNIQDTSYFSDLTTEDSIAFMQSFAKQQNVDICGITTSCTRAGRTSRVINGQAVNNGDFAEVVKITMGNSVCMATVIGERVIATTAHCVENGATATFAIGPKTYTAKMERSSLFPRMDHDLALGLVDQNVTGVKPAIVSGKAKAGLEVEFLGYGCVIAGGSGGNDGVLRIGSSTVTGLSNFDFVTKRANGGALCYGDSGGPAYGNVDNGYFLLGIGSKGDISTTSYFVDLSTKESTDFLKTFAATKKVEICGVNKTCN